VAQINTFSYFLKGLAENLFSRYSFNNKIGSLSKGSQAISQDASLALEPQNSLNTPPVNVNGDSATSGYAIVASKESASVSINNKVTDAELSSQVPVYKSDKISISSTAQTAARLDDSINASSATNAAIFKTALTGLVSNASSIGRSASSAVDNFLSIGVSMIETGNVKSFVDLSLVVSSINVLSRNSSQQVSSFVSQTQQAANSFGLSIASVFVDSAGTIMSAPASGSNLTVSRSGILNNFSRLWENVSNSNGLSIEQKTGALTRIAEDIKSKGSLTELNDYMNQELEKRNSSSEEENINGSSAGTGETDPFSKNRSNNVFTYSNNAYSNFVMGFQSSIQSASTDFSSSGLKGVERTLAAYKNNISLSSASAILNINA